MIGQIMPAGVVALQSGNPVILTLAQLGDDYNYIPSLEENGIHGSLVFSTTPSAPVAQNANRIRYSVYLDHDVGDFQFGEMALRMADGELFALFAASSLINKFALGGVNKSNAIKLEVFVDMTGGQYAVWLDLAETNNYLQVPRVSSPDALPQPKNASPNIYVIGAPSQEQQSTLATTDRTGLWAFYGFDFADTFTGTVLSADANGILISGSDYSPDFVPAYFGHLILQFSSGNMYGVCRYVLSTVQQIGGNWRISFNTPMALVPAAGTTFRIHSRNALEVSNIVLPIASATRLGAVIIGPSLTVDEEGRINVDFQGAITVEGVAPDENGNINLGLKAVATSGSYGSLLNIPGAFNPFLADDQTRGGIKLDPDGDFYLDVDEYLRFSGGGNVYSVNGRSGYVRVIGLLDPLPMGLGDDLDVHIGAGLYYAQTDADAQAILNRPMAVTATRAIIEIMPFSDGLQEEGSGPYSRLVMQRWTQVGYSAVRIGDGSTWTAWSSSSSVAIATATELGIVKIGEGLTIDSNGKLSTVIRSINGKSTENVTLSSSDVGALPVASLGTPGGPAGPLDIDPDEIPADPDLSEYVYGRMPVEQLPLGAVVHFADWDATTNAATITDDFGIVHTYTLLANGTMEDSWSPDGGVTTDTMTVPANGKAFRVSVAGDTTLDGQTGWRVGDIVVAIGSQWYRIAASTDPYTEITLTAAETVSLTVPAWVTDLTTAHVIVREKDVATDDWYDDTSGLTFSSTGITLQNQSAGSKTFRYRFVRG